MPKFEEQKGGYSREDYDKTEESEKDLKSQIAGAKTADEMIEIATKLKKAEGKKSELYDTAYDEATTENQEKTKQKEEYDVAHGEALVEDAERTKQKEEKEKVAKELEDLKSQHNSLKEQVAVAKSADEILELAGKIKDIEKRKGELGGNTQEDQQKKQQEEALKSAEQSKADANRDKEESTQKAGEILKKLKEKGTVESGENGRQALKESLESATMEFEKLKSEYWKINDERDKLLDKERERLENTNIPNFLKKVGNEAEEASIGLRGVMAQEANGKEDGKRWVEIVTERMNEILDESKANGVTGLVERTKIKMQVADFIKKSRKDSVLILPLNEKLGKLQEKMDEKQQEVNSLQRKYTNYRE